MSVSDSNERIYAITRLRTVTPGATDLQIGGVSPRGLWVGVAGDVTILADDDITPVVLKNVAAGVWHPISMRRISAATATDIVVGY